SGMSQPPKSTILAPRARWESLRIVLRVMAGGLLWGGPPLSPTVPPAGAGSVDLADLEHHAVGRDHPHAGAGLQLRPADHPVGVADLHPSLPAADRAVQDHDAADVLLGAAVEQRSVAGPLA